MRRGAVAGAVALALAQVGDRRVVGVVLLQHVQRRAAVKVSPEPRAGAAGEKAAEEDARAAVEGGLVQDGPAGDVALGVDQVRLAVQDAERLHERAILGEREQLPPARAVVRAENGLHRCLELGLLGVVARHVGGRLSLEVAQRWVRAKLLESMQHRRCPPEASLVHHRVALHALFAIVHRARVRPAELNALAEKRSVFDDVVDLDPFVVVGEDGRGRQRLSGVAHEDPPRME